MTDPRHALAISIPLLLALFATSCATVQKAALLGPQDLEYFAPEQFLDVDGYPICFVDSGIGEEPLVFIHPWGGNSGYWNAFAAAFSDRYRVIAIDLPGHGKSDTSERAYDIELAARAVMGVVDELDLTGVTLIGNSMGGGVSLVVARDRPDRVSRLVLIDALGGGPVPGFFGFFIRQFATPELFLSIGDGIFQFFTERFVFDSSGPASDALIAELFALREGSGSYAWATAIVGYLKAATDFDARPWLCRIQAPTLILWGDNDWILWERSAEVLVESIPDAELEFINNCGHMPELEQPAEVIARLQAFLDRTPTPGENRW